MSPSLPSVALAFVAFGMLAAACSSSESGSADGGTGGATILGKAGSSGAGTGGAAGKAGKAGAGGVSGVGGASLGGGAGKAANAGTGGASGAAGAGNGGNAGTGSAGKAGSSPCGFCVPGDTQPCTGPAACKGGQGCKDDGCGWKVCDCGSGGAAGAPTGAGGAAASAGSGTAGMTPGAGGMTALFCPTANPGSPVILGSAGSAGMAGTILDLHQAKIFDNPQNLADWPVTTKITVLEFGSAVHVEFDKQDGPNRWPDIIPPGWTGPLQYTLGMAEYVDGQWVASAAIEYWYGLASSGGPPPVSQDYQVACNWYYDGRWGPLEKRQPAVGEIIGIFVVAGNLRGVKDGSQSPVMERSDVVLVPMPSVAGAKYTF